MKGNRGITLVILIVTVVIMLILASVGIYVGMDSVKHSRVVKFVSYMQIIQRKVDELVADNNYSELGISAVGQSNAQAILAAASANGEIQNTDASQYRYFDESALSSQLGLDNIEDEIIINFATREVVSLNGIEYESKMYYTQYLLPTGQQIVIKSADETRTLSFDFIKNIDGLQANIQITNISIANGTLSYKEENGQWKVINNYTETNVAENVSISKSGTYTFKLKDNTNNNVNTLEEEVLLGNQPELPEEWSYTKEDYDYSLLVNNETGLIDISQMSSSSATAQDASGNPYYWIPRFAYKEENGNRIIKLIKGTSQIATDNTTIDGSWTIPEEFSNTEEVGYLTSTGIWFSTSDIIENLFN